MNKTLKIILNILLITIMLFMVCATISNATNVKPTEIAKNLTGTESTAQGSITDIGNSIIGIITTVGVVVAVVVLLVLGIKYMMGSASEKAEYKKTMIPYIVGAVLIFGASAITKVIISISTSITAGTGN